jgi:hypothetical protein
MTLIRVVMFLLSMSCFAFVLFISWLLLYLAKWWAVPLAGLGSIIFSVLGVVLAVASFLPQVKKLKAKQQQQPLTRGAWYGLRGWCKECGQSAQWYCHGHNIELCHIHAVAHHNAGCAVHDTVRHSPMQGVTKP